MSIFHDLDKSPPDLIFRNKLGALMFVTINQFMGALFGTLLNFLNERPVFL